jgi:archaellum biogenesis protein FlaJ (TadC family)
MLKNYKFSVAFVSLYLLVYTVLIGLSASFLLLSVLFFLSPFLIIWMVYTILRYAPYHDKEYEGDIPDNELRGKN